MDRDTQGLVGGNLLGLVFSGDDVRNVSWI